MKGYIEIEVPVRKSTLTGFGGCIECDVEGVKFFANAGMAHDLERARKFWRDNGIEVSTIDRPKWAPEDFAYGFLEPGGFFTLVGCETAGMQTGYIKDATFEFDVPEYFEIPDDEDE